MRIRLTVAIIITTLLMALVAPAVRVSAKESAQQYTVLRVINDNSAVRQENHNKGKVIKKAAFGSLLYGVEKKVNSKQNLWWKLADGTYIFDGNVEDTGVKASLLNEQHICNGTIKSVVGNSYCAMGDGKNHYRTTTYDILCVCGACVSSTNYEIFEEPCDYELGLTSGTCKYCKNEENSATVVLNKAVTSTKNMAETLGNEMTSTDTFGKTVEGLVLGENAEEQTVSGVILETIASFTGTDVLLDARDLTTSITNFNKNSKEEGWWKAAGAVGFNALCILPIFGGFVEVGKNLDKVTDAVKAAEKAGDITSSVKSIKKVEKAVEVMDAGTTAAKAADKVDNATDVVKTADAVADSAQTAAKAVDRTADITDNANDVAKAAVTVYDPEFAAKQLLQDGKTTEEALKNIIPKNATNTFVPTSTISEGYKYKFDINGNKIEVKYHSKDLNAAVKYPGSNSGAGWTAQINVNGKLLGQDGVFYKKPGNITHIPME